MNPAVLSASFRGLFPDGVVAAELRGPGDASQLLPEEAGCLGRAVQKRIQEFAAGRLCARRALAEFGIEGFALRVRSDRQPAWPPSMVGSITHSGGLCAAVVAPAAAFIGLGVDSEVVGDVKPDIWPKICVSRESAWLDTLPAAAQAGAATLIFAAKEAFFKSQYPAVGEFLGFQDVMIEPQDWGAAQARFTVHAMRDLAIGRCAVLPVTGRYRFHEEFASAGVALGAAVAEP